MPQAGSSGTFAPYINFMDDHNPSEVECEASECEMKGVAYTGIFIISVMLLLIVAVIFN
jgi:hypothetical protein